MFFEGAESSSHFLSALVLALALTLAAAMVRESNPRSHLSFDFSILQIWNQHLLTKLNLFEISVCVLLNDPKINKKNICLNVLNRLVSFCYILRIFEKREELGKIDYASYFHVWFIGLDKVGLIYFCLSVDYVK